MDNLKKGQLIVCINEFKQIPVNTVFKVKSKQPSKCSVTFNAVLNNELYEIKLNEAHIGYNFGIDKRLVAKHAKVDKFMEDFKLIRVKRGISHETEAFEAELTYKGVIIGSMWNDGNGGPDGLHCSLPEHKKIIDDFLDQFESIKYAKYECFSAYLLDDINGIITFADYLNINN